MSLEHFSQLERFFLKEETWFESMRILERYPQLVSKDFSRRLAVVAEATEDEAEMHLLQESSEVLARALAVGVEEAFREKIGNGGLFAGQARETRDLYYESRKPRVLGEAINQFVEALSCNDDPLAFDQGRTLRGFGATLFDLSNLVRDPIINHVGCLAYLGAAMGYLAADTPFAEESWLEYLVSLLGGMRKHLDLAESFAPETEESEFHRSVRRACQLVEDDLVEAGGFWERLAASLPILALAFACQHVDLPEPETTSSSGLDLQKTARFWRDIVVIWIERYGSDCFRGLIAAPPSNLFEPEGASPAHGRRFNPPSPDEVFAEFEPDDVLLQAPLTPARVVLAVLMMAVLSALPAPDKARSRLEMAEFILADAMEASAADRGSPFHSPTFLATLAAGVGAYLREGSGQFERFTAIRQAWSTSWLEEVVAIAEAELSGDPDQVDQSSPAVEAAAQAAMCMHDPVALLAAIANDLRLPDASRYRRTLDHLKALSFNRSGGGDVFLVDEDTPGLTEQAELLARFQGDPSSLDETEREELCDWLGAAYEAGRVSFPNANAELTLLINLGWLYLKSCSEDTLKWSARARRLALDEGALVDAATADLNISSFYLEVLRHQPPWSVDVDRALGRLHVLLGALSHALEALRIATVGLRFSDPEDRFHVGTLGYGEVRLLIEELLFEARDASLLTEYLLNARGMWFLLDLYDAASEIGDGPERPVVSWRDRSWVARSLPVDQDLPVGRGSAADVDVAEILSPAGEPQALWFGSMLEKDGERIASSLLAPPDAFTTTFEYYPASLCEPGAMSCLETAEALGSLFPEPGWRAAEAAHERGMRSVLFVSPDPGLPPIAMGMWRNPHEGSVSVLADLFDVVYCPTLAPRRGAMTWTDESRPAAPQAFVVCDPLGDLSGARVVPELAHRVCGNAGRGVRPPANRETVLATIDACSLADGVLVYQGHSQSGGIDEPGAACLLLEPLGPSWAVAEPLRLRELLAGVRDSSSGRMPRRVAFLSCASGSTAAPYDATGLAMGALAAGSNVVVSTLQPVSDSGRWDPTVDQMVDVLRAPQPWTAFAHWQRQAARELEAMDSEDARWALSSLTMFGGPYVRGDATVAGDE